MKSSSLRRNWSTIRGVRIEKSAPCIGGLAVGQRHFLPDSFSALGFDAPVLSGWCCSVLFVSVQQLIPQDLASIAPGPELARVLAGIELSRLSGFDCVEVLKAQYRQANHERARVLAAMVEVGMCGVGPAGDELRRMAPDEFSADEIRAALMLTRRASLSRFPCKPRMTDSLNLSQRESSREENDQGIQCDFPATRAGSGFASSLT